MFEGYSIHDEEVDDSTEQIKKPLLIAEHVRVAFSGAEHLIAIEDVSMTIFPGEVHGLVGESGSGKTVFTKSLIRILPPNGHIVGGKIIWKGEDLVHITDEKMRSIRGKHISMIFQNPQASLNPVRTIKTQLLSLIRHQQNVSKAEAIAQSFQLLKTVQIADPQRVLGLYPFECSGGMCQRILIAMALSSKPELLIADEPTSSLDVTIQAEIIRLLLRIKNEYGMAMLFVSHDLAIVGSICDRVSVMYQGRIVETGSPHQLFRIPDHPYTKNLVESSVLFRSNLRQN